MNINLHHLELFYYVAEAEGISNAVKVMPYSIQQPAISQQIVSLEKHLGVKLFERRPFCLTDAGRVLLAVVAPFATVAGSAPDDSKGTSPLVPEDLLTEDMAIEELALRLTPLTVAELAATAEAWREMVKAQTQFSYVKAYEIIKVRAE